MNPPPIPSAGSAGPPSITVCAAANFVSDLGVSYAQSGGAFSFVNHTPTSKGTYSMSPSGTYLFAPGDENTLVRIAYEYSTAASYVPNLTPVYSIGDDDVIYQSGDDPIKVTRSDPFQAYNVWRLEITARDDAYALIPIESRDQDAIERYGLRVSSSVEAHEICDENVAAISGQLMLQRALYIRNTHKFKLSWEFCLLDPMDIIEINDANLAFSNYAVRITEIEEGDDGTLTVTAEELPVGVANAPLYPTRRAASRRSLIAMLRPIRSMRRSSSSRRRRSSVMQKFGLPLRAAPVASPIRTGAAAMSISRSTIRAIR